MNFSALDGENILGKLARLPLRLIPPGTVVPVLQGPLRGTKWIVGAGNHGCWLGSYELANLHRFAQIVKPGGIVFDIGAHAGYYTLLASRLVGSTGSVFAFEPLPHNLNFLEKHLSLNHLRNVVIQPVAVSEKSGQAKFEPGESNYTGRLSDRGYQVIQTIALDEEITGAVLPRPNVLKIDVEGAELLVLHGASGMISHSRPSIFLSIHSRDNHFACRRLLEDLGYWIEPVKSKKEDQFLDFFAFGTA